MENPLPLTFLGYAQWNRAKQMGNSNFHSIFDNTTVTANLFKILEVYPEFILNIE